MAYSDFRLDEVIEKFSLDLEEATGLFAEIPEYEPSDYLKQTLAQNLDLAVAINTEKARSEMIISPILLELMHHRRDHLSFFSGVDFSVDQSQGLTGICDFLISKSPEQLFVRAPVVTIVEAKNENLKSGFGQCLAEMLAAQFFNQRKGNQIPVIYGVVTIGTIWRFLQLTEKTVQVDLSEYYIQNLNRILGILLHFVS